MAYLRRVRETQTEARREVLRDLLKQTNEDGITLLLHQFFFEHGLLTEEGAVPTEYHFVHAKALLMSPSMHFISWLLNQPDSMFTPGHKTTQMANLWPLGKVDFVFCVFNYYLLTFPL